MALGDFSRSAALGFKAGEGQAVPSAMNLLVKGMLEQKETLLKRKADFTQDVALAEQKEKFKSIFKREDPFKIAKGKAAERFEAGTASVEDKRLIGAFVNPLELILAQQAGFTGGGEITGEGKEEAGVTKKVRNKKTGKTQTLKLVNGKWVPVK